MWWIQLPQSPAPAWVGPVAAISLLVIALVYLGIGIGLLLAARALAAKQRALADSLRELRRDLAPALESVKRIAADGEHMARAVRHEIVGVTRTTRRLRRRVDLLADRMAQRLDELDALYEVVQDEVEETALDLAAGLRRARRGGWLGRLTGLLLGGGRA
ncbi:MAG TPA: hypothetical protein VNK43_03355 [Gemmatimonadales bacterium]|nr:hypothetical protein [Gemmatimonadales bacterium]